MAIFAAAAQRLGVPLERILHVGDSEVDDLEGARAAGMMAFHLQRDVLLSPEPGPVIGSLADLPDRIV